MHAFAVVPDVVQAHAAHIAAGETHGGQGRAAFDRTVGLQRQNGLAGGATGPVHALVAEAAPQVFIRAVIADVVADIHQQATVDTFAIQPRKQRHHFEQLIGLQQQLRMIHRVAHGDGDLDLPMGGAEFDDGVHQRWQVGQGRGADLGVDAHRQPRGFGPAQGVHGLVERAGNVAHRIVQRRKAIEGNAHAVEPGIHRRLHLRRGQVAPAGLDCAVHAVVVNGLDQLCPVLAQIGFTADQGDFASAERGQ